MDRAEAIKRLTMCLDCTDCLTCAEHDMAIAALREQEQREQECEYCHPPFKNLFAVTINLETGEEITTIYTDCDGQSLRFYDDNPGNPQIDKVPINFCPMCGRKLGGAE